MLRAVPNNNQPIILTLEPSDAAIVLKSDGTFEASLPRVFTDNVPENILTGAALMYALRDENLCNLIQLNFEKECARIKRQTRT